MQEYSLADLIFICNVVCSSLRYSTYEQGGMKKVILLLEKLEEMFNSVKESEE